MSTIRFEGDPAQGGIPKKSMVRIEALPEQTPVFVGKVTEALTIELDPGKYIFSVTRLSPKKMKRVDDVCYTGTFLHEVSEEAWEKLRWMTPTLARVINTSEGPRWRCKLAPVMGCDFEGTSPIAALLHQMVEHLGMKREEFLADPTGSKAKAAFNKSVQIEANAAAVEKRDSRLAAVFGPEVAKELANNED